MSVGGEVVGLGIALRSGGAAAIKSMWPIVVDVEVGVRVPGGGIAVGVVDVWVVEHWRPAVGRRRRRDVPGQVWWW